MPLRLVAFDLWGTLIVDGSSPNDGARARMAAAALASLGMPYDETRILSAFAEAAHEHSRIHLDGRDIAAGDRTVLYLRHLDPDIARKLDDDGWRRMHEAILTAALHVRPLLADHAVESLAAVKALGLATVLVSNAGTTPGFVLRQILEDYGILRYLDHAVFSDEVEIAKPHPAIFEHALELSGTAPADAIFVGDQPVLDVLGPRNAGLWSAQVGDLAEDGIEPHVRIASLRELLPALRTLGLLPGAGVAPAGPPRVG